MKALRTDPLALLPANTTVNIHVLPKGKSPRRFADVNTADGLHLAVIRMSIESLVWEPEVDSIHIGVTWFDGEFHEERIDLLADGGVCHRVRDYTAKTKNPAFRVIVAPALDRVA